MEDIVIEQGAGAEPAPAAPAGAVSGMDGAVIVQQTGTETKAAPPTGESVGVSPEAQGALNHEIRQLWAAHGELLAEARRSKEEALAILLELGKRLSDAKERLARPGRNGGWSSFARSLGISRAEADGLVRRYRRSLNPQAACTTGAETAMAAPASGLSPADAEVCPEAAEVVALSAPATEPVPQPPQGGSAIPAETPAAEPAPQPSEEGPATADESPASAPATDLAPQPSGETPAAIEEPAAEAAAAPTEAGQAPAVADAGSGAVA